MTTISWTNETWNPIAAFDKATGKRGWICVHAGIDCLHCYAEQMNRWRGNGNAYRVPSLAKLEFELVNLRQPLSWKEPRMIFVCSMTDLFLDAYPDAFIAAIFAVMAVARRHTFQVLTKRPERMRDFLSNPDIAVKIMKLIRDVQGSPDLSWVTWPLPNVWMGTSVGHQQYVAKRIPALLETSAAIRFLSAEPLLSELQIAEYLPNKLWNDLPSWKSPEIGWVIVGGESGARARPCAVQWIRSIVDQCNRANVPVFVKQLGSRPFDERLEACDPKLKDAKGEDPDEWPLHLRVREWPREVAHA